MNNTRRTLALILLLCVLACGQVSALAGFGDFSGGSDYGSYDSGSSYDSYDSGYSSSYDDDDRGHSSGGSFSWGGGGGDSGGGGPSLSESMEGLKSSYAELNFGERVMFIVLLLAILLVVFGVPVWFIGKIIKIARGVSGRKKPQKPLPEGAARTTDLQPLRTLMAWDEAFSPAAMEARLSNLFVRMQHAWTARDMTSLRADFTDAQYAQYDRQLQAYRDARQTNHVDNIAVLGVELRGVKRSGEQDLLVADLRTRFTTCTVQDETGAVVRGSFEDEIFMVYEWTLVRPHGKKTQPATDGAAFNCPNCGAPMRINHSARCDYCHSVVSKADYDWVIANIKGLAQRTERGKGKRR